MANTDHQVKLFGTEESPFCFRAIWALKLKGIPFKYIDEYGDITGASCYFSTTQFTRSFQFLFMEEKPICESMVIVEYIDETWPQNPLFPNDPYGKAQARFWVKYADDTVPAILTVFTGSGEELEKAKKVILEMLRVMEEQSPIGEKKFFGGDKIGIADIAFGWTAHWLAVIEEVVGVKLLKPKNYLVCMLGSTTSNKTLLSNKPFLTPVILWSFSRAIEKNCLLLLHHDYHTS
ncbi:hypothetical protein FEM48_ZijujUnG0114400 [Ziziphus jujuba var. spinosa]|uniref:Glutathione S-transferase n=1 Tax=Ziziphus jujuba var. spinosa TaxID=714518 RepID=A0A978U7Z4_ZIZJJ|nr:hypothetical protein FEM48_ZijujUnG0114400 [Ziziphus jujuba var. spinosa]